MRRDLLPQGNQAFNALAITLVLVLTGCGLFTSPSAQSADSAWQSVAQGMGVQDWNESLEVSLPDPVGDPLVGETVHILIMNRSDRLIEFPLGYGAKALLYSQEEHSWIELTNEMDYVGEEDVLEPRESPASNWVAQVSVRPAVPSVKEETILRLLVIGNVVSTGPSTEERVGAYIDLNISP